MGQGKADEFRQARTHAEAALQGMIAHQVPPTPENYAVWYAYATGMPELRRTIDILISNKQEFSEALNAELYSRFCDTNRHLNVVSETSGRLHYAIEQVSRFLKSASGEASDFGKTLDQFSNEMGAVAEDNVEFRAVVSGLIFETQRMIERNGALEDRLNQSVSEIAELRQNLEEVRREALTDALTGIPNRKFFDSRLQEAARESLNDGEALSLLLCDIDHFKRFNDTYGHQIGDQVLRLVARTLSDSVKGRDTPARFGGEEFAIILPHTNLDQAAIVADQIRKGVMRRRFVGKDTRDDYGGVTLSFGVAQYRAHEDLADLIGRADAALYHAKREGRNRVSTEREASDLARAS
jgi:diguanylate cyclase